MIHRFPSGRFTLERHHAWLWADAVQSVHKTTPHPGVAIMIAFRGCGASIQQVMDHLNTDPQNVLFGELDLVFVAPLRTETTYIVDLGISTIDHKKGGRIGNFDLVTLNYVIQDAQANICCTELTQKWVVMRPGGVRA